jgi:hypothetical protein
LGSEIWDLDKPISDPGSQIQGSKRHRIPDPQHWSFTAEKKLVEAKLLVLMFILVSFLQGIPAANTAG